MKIWQLDPFGLTPYYDHALCQALADAGHEVHLFASPHPYDSASLPQSNYTVHDDCYSFGRLERRASMRRLLRMAGYPSAHRRLLARLDLEPPEVVHIQWCRLPLVDCWLVRAIQARGIPVIHTVHDVDPLFSFAFIQSLGSVYAAANRLIVHAHENRERLLSRYPHLAPKTTAIPHIGARWPEPLNASSAQAREYLKIPSDVPVLLFFGSSRPYKGLDLLLEAVCVARRTTPELWLIVAGRIDTLREIRALSRMGDQTVICTRYVPSDQVWLYHRAADAAVFPYRQVSQSGALISAMAFGMPVIVSAVGGMPETVDGNGWIVPANDADMLASAIVELANNRSQLVKMGQRSLELIRERHSSELVAQATVAVYQEARADAANSLCD